MSLPLVFRRAARAEFDEASDYHEQIRPGLGVRFTAAVDRTLNRILQQPDFYPIVHEDVREAPVRKFRYCVYYRLELEQIVVTAVFHTSRNPSIWQRRV